MIDAHLRHGNALRLDPRRVTWPRVSPVNDGSLRKLVVGLGGPSTASRARVLLRDQRGQRGHGDRRPRPPTAPTCAAASARIVVGQDLDRQPRHRAEQLGAAGAMSVLLRDALHPTLAQTSEGTPALIHAGPFANIAHGNNSLLATRFALTRAPWVVTECGFGADLGLEKFMHIKARSAASARLRRHRRTVRALKVHAGVAKVAVGKPLDQLVSVPDVEAVERGAANLRHHLRIAAGFGAKVVVALNRFPSDSPEAEIAAVEPSPAGPAPASPPTPASPTAALAPPTSPAPSSPPPSRPPTFRYGLDAPAASPSSTPSPAPSTAPTKARHQPPPPAPAPPSSTAWGYGALPLCVAKTHLACTHDPADGGLPRPASSCCPSATSSCAPAPASSPSSPAS
jgi:formate--tetrahydrofolate ligase